MSRETLVTFSEFHGGKESHPVPIQWRTTVATDSHAKKTTEEEENTLRFLQSCREKKLVTA